MSDKWYECPTCCYSTTSERNFLKHGLTHVDAPAPAQPTGEGLTTQVILDRQEKAGCYTDTVSRSTHATENQSTKMTEAAQSTTVVHVPIPEGNESRYVEVLREQSQATQPTSCKDCDGTGRFVDQSEGCSPFSGRSCRSCNGTGKQAEQPVAEPSDNDTINMLRITLKACRMKFLDYVNIHQERGNVDKAKSNQRMVDLCTRTLQESQATLPPSSSELTWKEVVSGYVMDKNDFGEYSAPNYLQEVKRQVAAAIEQDRRRYAASLEARLGTLRKELGERTMTEATAIDEMREAEARANKAEARNKELEQAPRFNEKKHIERMVAAGCAIDFDPITLDLIITNERADSLSLLLREVEEVVAKRDEQISELEQRHVRFMVQGGPVVMATEFDALKERLQLAMDALCGVYPYLPSEKVDPELAKAISNADVLIIPWVNKNETT